MSIAMKSESHAKRASFSAIYPELTPHYKLIKTIGKGNFAKVKSAKHIATNKPVAIKIISKRKISDQNLKKVNREISILKEISHPNIIQLFEIIESDSYFFIISEIASGGELFDHLVNNGRMRENVARKKFAQLLSAVAYCHKHGIVHRDLKAENILLDDHDNIKLADFGFANFYSLDKKLDTYCGSPPYAAPELFQAKKYTGPEVDIWSIGVILFTLVTGSLPFDGENISELRECVLAGKFRVPYYVSAECESLIKHMLTKNPEKRYTLSDIKLSKWYNQNKRQSPSSENSPIEEINGEITMEDVDYAVNKSFIREKVLESIKQRKFDPGHAIYLISKKYHLSASPKSPVKMKKTSLNDSFPTDDGLSSPQHPNSKSGRTVSEVLRLRRPLSAVKKLVRRPKTEIEVERDSLMPVEKDLSNVPQKLLERQPKIQIPPGSISTNAALENNIDKLQRMTSPTEFSLSKEKEDSGTIVKDLPKLASKPKSLFLPFNVKKVKKKISIEEIVYKLRSTLEKMDIQYQSMNDFVVHCYMKQHDGVDLVVEIEIFRLAGTHPYGFRAKRIRGTAINYKNILDTIYSSLDFWKK